MTVRSPLKYNPLMAKRGKWKSTLGFVLAAAGSAVGLGNIWRFPYVTGKNGGAVFLFFYILAVIFLGLVVMYAELSLGRATQKNPVGAFEKIKPFSPWKAVGFLGVFTGVGILSYYSVIAGWTLYYFYISSLGKFSEKLTEAQIDGIFSSFVSKPFLTLPLLLIFIFITSFIVSRGISSGIERWTGILMPLLFLILLVLSVYSLTLPGASEGLKFYLKPDFSKVNLKMILSAVGQAFFSLSLGMGAMITYGSYLPKEDNLFSSGIEVVAFDTLVAFLAGIIIFPTVFTYGLSPRAGVPLVFKTLPFTFSKLPLGRLFGPLFFFLLTIAALTSTISLVEVATSYLVDEKKIPRPRAAFLVGAVAFLLGIPSALSTSSRFFSRFAFGKSFLDLMDYIWANLSLPLGALLLSVFVGYVWGAEKAAVEIRPDKSRKFPGEDLWIYDIKYFVPLALSVILLFAVLGSS